MAAKRTRGNPKMGGREWWSIYRLVGWRFAKIPPVLFPRPVSHVYDHRESIRPPIHVKPRPTRSARRARQFYLTSIPFRERFTAPNKIIHLLNKWVFRSDGDGWSCAGSCDGARVKPGVAKGRVPWWKGSVTHAGTKGGGNIITN